MKSTALFVLTVFDFRKLGTCALCMQAAFSAAAVSCLLVTAVAIMAPSLAATIGVCAGALAALWFAHIATAAVRSIPERAFLARDGRARFSAFGRALLQATSVSMGVMPEVNTVEAATCGQACSKSNDNCPSGCICWWELGKCVQLGTSTEPKPTK